MNATDRHIYYRAGYKYQLAQVYTHELPKEFAGVRVVHPYFSILRTGPKPLLMVKDGYAWDGASGPAVDSPCFMRGSLVHDVIYQALRENLIPGTLDTGLDVRKWADEELVRVCREDGMPWIRTRWVLWAVRTFGGRNTTRETRPYQQAP